MDFQQVASSVRKEILIMSNNAHSAHTGGSLSVVEILISLYFHVLHIDEKSPEDPARDRVVFSKAHDAKALYAVLAARGFFDKRILRTYEMNDGILPGHTSRLCVPGVEVSTGSLGHGLSMACGMAFAIKYESIPTKRRKKSRSKRRIPRVFAVLSDGECQEGSTWEALLFAVQHKLDNLVVIIDYNKLQGFGFVKDILNLEPFADKMHAFGAGVKEVDGHDVVLLNKTFDAIPFDSGSPSVVITHTIKGKGGVAKYVNQVSSQYAPPTKEELQNVLTKLDKNNNV